MFKPGSSESENRDEHFLPYQGQEEITLPGHADQIKCIRQGSASQYCFDNMRGDCGIQGLLFTALCRIAGVPARWQSGWILSNMHDWAQFYVEPYGWLWADPSMCIMDEDPEIRWFLFGNIDNTRLSANNDDGMEFDPPKWHFRSEPVDFQRGEVEWRGGNLYFGQWSYSMKRETIE